MRNESRSYGRNRNQPSDDLFAEGVLSIVEFADFIGVRRSKAYGIVASGEVEFVRIGADRKVPRLAAIAYLRRQFEKQRE